MQMVATPPTTFVHASPSPGEGSETPGYLYRWSGRGCPRPWTGLEEAQGPGCKGDDVLNFGGGGRRSPLSSPPAPGSQAALHSPRSSDLGLHTPLLSGKVRGRVTPLLSWPRTPPGLCSVIRLVSQRHTRKSFEEFKC